MPLVSVIIPTHNRAGLVPRAVESVLAQSFPDYELIVVDDGSTDETPKALARFRNRIRVVRQENRGVSAARNRGIQVSSGELIAFLDSDDEWLPEKLALQVERYASGSARFICHTDEIWRRNGREVSQKSIHRKQGGRFFERALERCLISPSSVMVSRELLDRVGWFDEDLPAAEDYDLWLRITAFYDVIHVPESLVIKHGGHAGQLSFTVPAIDRFRIAAIRKILEHADLPKAYREAAVRELERKCAIVATGCDKRGKTEEANEYRRIARWYADRYRRTQ